MERSKHGLFVFSPKKILIRRRHCSIGQSCCSMTSKRSIGWFLESSRAWNFSPERSLNQPKPTHVCIRSINQSNRSISVRLLFPFCSRVFISRSYENRSLENLCLDLKPVLITGINSGVSVRHRPPATKNMTPCYFQRPAARGSLELWTFWCHFYGLIDLLKYGRKRTSSSQPPNSNCIYLATLKS